MPRPLPTEVLAATGGDIDSVRDHILDAALRAINGHGLAGASTRVIAAEAGVAAGTLYNYFDDRLQLLARAILRRAHVLSRPVADLAASAGEGTVAGNLHEVARHAVSVLDELVPLIGAAFSDTDLLAALRREMAVAPASADPAHGLERYLLAEQEIGRIASEADCSAAASTIVGVCHDRAFHRFLRGARAEPEGVTREIDFVVRALTATEDPPVTRRSSRPSKAKGTRRANP